MFNTWNKDLAWKKKIQKEKKQIRASRKSLYKTKYGLTLERYNALFLYQKGCCAICNLHQSLLKRRLAVDHCHDSTEVRALLCHNCNVGLGHFKDDPKILQRAIDYLVRFKQVLGATEKAAGAFK